MRTRNLFSFVVVGSWLSLLAGCGGVDTNNCPNGKCRAGCSSDTYVAGGSCVPFTICEPGSYVVEEATATTDRICEACASGSFSTTPNSPACMVWRTCQPGSYVASAPSATADRVCSACGTGTYTSGLNQSACLGVGDCPAGTIETTPSSATAPHACTPCSTGEYCAGGKAKAVSCSGEKWDNDGSPATDCVAKTVCGPGTASTRPGSASTDRVCTMCGGGTFSTTENASSCTPWSTCLAGTYVANTPSPSTDRWCVPCPADSFTSGDNQSSCRSVNDCPAGTTETAPGTATTPPECTACVSGQYCEGGGAAARPCGDQTWDHDGNPATACIAWSFCLPGYYVSSSGTATADRTCIACPDGTFTADVNTVICSPWSDCEPGNYVVGQPNTQSDRTCDTCTTSTFSDSKNESMCQPWSTCPANTTFTAGGSSWADVRCLPCSDNGCPAFCTSSGTCVDCLDYRDCAAGLSCVEGACKDLGCSGTDRYFLETFSSPPSAQFWTMSGEWEFGNAAAGATDGGRGPNGDPLLGHTSDTDTRVGGVVVGGNVSATIMTAPAYLTSAPIDISQGPSPVYLEFYRWLNSDASTVNSVEVSDGDMWVPLWTGEAVHDEAWMQQVFDVTRYRNPYFRVRFGYMVTNADAAAFGSWNIDDLRIANTFTCGWPPD